MWEDWDPIGVNVISTADDEYHNYIPGVYALLNRGATVEEICDHLAKIEEEYMGLTPYPTKEERRKNILVVVEKLISEGKKHGLSK